jgi:hypothetical protein
MRAGCSGFSEVFAEIAAVSLEIGDRVELNDVCHAMSPPCGESLWVDTARNGQVKVKSSMCSELWNRDPWVTAVNASRVFQQSSEVVDGVGT